MGIEEMTDEQELAQLNSGIATPLPISDEQELAELNGMPEPEHPLSGYKADKLTPYGQLNAVFRGTDKDPVEEGARIVQSFIDADNLDIPPDAAYKMQEVIGVYAGKDGLFRRGKDESSWVDVVKSWGKSFTPMFGQTVGGIERIIGESESAPIESGFGLGAGKALTSPAILRAQSEREKAWRLRIKEQGEALYAGATETLQEAQPEVNEGSLKYYVQSAGLSVTHMLPLLAAGAITRNPYAVMSLMALDVKGQEYGDLRARGIDPDLAGKASTAYALAEAIPEALPLGVLFKPGSKFLPRLAKFIGAEEGQELFTETLRIAIDRGVLSEDVTWGEAKKRLEEVAIVTPLSAGAIAGITHPFIKSEVVDEAVDNLRKHGVDPDTAREEVQKYVDAVAEAAGVEEAPADIAGLPEGSPVPEPIPDLTTEEAAAVEQSTIETDDLTERAVLDLVMEGVDLETLTDEQIAERVQSYEQAPFEQGEAALKMPVETVEAPTGVKTGATEEQRATSSVEGQTPIYRAVAEQLRAAMPESSESDIHAQATLWDSFFRTMGERAGIKPEELFGRYRVKIARDYLTESKRTGKAENIRTLADFIRDSGGISAKDEHMQGEVRDKFSIKEGYNLINNKTGKTLDLLAEAAWEAGYFAERPSVTEFLDALGEDVDARTSGTGSAVFAREDLDAAMESQLDEEYRRYLGAQGEEFEQSAYHGTPHKFDKFTLDHIGKGEGAQAYGWGLYFAENKDVAEWYRDKLAGAREIKNFSLGEIKFLTNSEYLDYSPRYPQNATQEQKSAAVARAVFTENVFINEWAIREAFDKDGIKGVKKYLLTLIDDKLNDEGQDPLALEYYEKLKWRMEEGKIKPVFEYGETPGTLYKVNLTPEKDEYLDWNKPLSDQSEKVREILQPFRDKYRETEGVDGLYIGDSDTGRDIYNALISDFHQGRKKPIIRTERGGFVGDHNASLYLKSIGIPGIKYLEGASRGKGEGQHNFVIFDEELIEIEEFYQKKGKTPRARISFGPDGVNISLLKNADLSSFLHETGHFYLKVMEDLGRSEGAPKDIKADLKTVLDWLKVESVDQIGVKQHERFARGFEKYLAEGKAPSVDLRAAFARFREWLIAVYKQLKGLNVQLSDDVRAVMDRMLATEEEIYLARKGEAVTDQAKGLVSTLPTRAVKGQVNRAAGVKKIYNLIREDEALSAAWKKAEQASRIAFREGKTEEAAKWKAKMQEIVAEIKAKAADKIAAIKTEKQKIAARRRQINNIIEYLELSDSQVKKLIKKDIRLMTDYEFFRFKEVLHEKGVLMQEKAFEKARVMEAIESKRLQKVENYRNALGLPSYDKMTTMQLKEFADALEQFADGDVFLTQRELETVDKTDLKGIRTWREAKEALAKELGVPVEKLDTIKATAFDNFRWDTSLAEKNPFYGLLVETTIKGLMTAEARVHEIENRVFELAKKSEKSKGRTLTEKLIPQDKQVFEYLEAQADMKSVLAAEMTPEQLDLANYMKEYFGQALEYLIKTQAIERGRENYITHIRRSFLETLKEDGLGKAVLSVFQNYQQDEMVFNILDGDTGNILPLEKFFQFSMHRTGALEPTQNVVRAFLTYAKTFEKKVVLDQMIPKLDIYAQSLTPVTYTPRGLEVDRSLKKFVNRYINNKKGRQLGFDSVIKQGGAIDLSIRALRSFTTLLDLGFSIPVGLGTFVGEQIATLEMTGVKGYALAAKRMASKQGQFILKQYEHFTGRSFWENFTAPGKEVGDRVMEGMFGFFHVSTVMANKQFLLASLTEEEFNSGEINPERLAEIRLEMGRFRAIPGTRSLVGSTSIGGAAMQYKTWAVVIARTLIKDMNTLATDLRSKPAGEALTSREAKEIYRAIGLTLTALIVLGAGDDERNRSFTGQLMRKIRSESLTIVQAISPDMWLSTPRLLGFISQLGKNLKSLVLLEEYKTKPGLKGVEGLKRQFTPGAVRPLLRDEDDNKSRARVQ